MNITENQKVTVVSSGKLFQGHIISTDYEDMTYLVNYFDELEQKNKNSFFKISDNTNILDKNLIVRL